MHTHVLLFFILKDIIVLHVHVDDRDCYENAGKIPNNFLQCNANEKLCYSVKNIAFLSDDDDNDNIF